MQQVLNQVYTFILFSFILFISSDHSEGIISVLYLCYICIISVLFCIISVLFCILLLYVFQTARIYVTFHTPGICLDVVGHNNKNIKSQMSRSVSVKHEHCSYWTLFLRPPAHKDFAASCQRGVTQGGRPQCFLLASGSWRSTSPGKYRCCRCTQVIEEYRS